MVTKFEDKIGYNSPLVVHAKQQEEEDSKRIEIQWLVLLHSLLHHRQHRDKTE